MKSVTLIIAAMLVLYCGAYASKEAETVTPEDEIVKSMDSIDRAMKDLWVRIQSQQKKVEELKKKISASPDDESLQRNLRVNVSLRNTMIKKYFDEKAKAVINYYDNKS